MAKTIKKIREEAPTVSAGSGQIAGIGVGPKGEPGVDPKKTKYKKENEKKSAILFSMLRRKMKGQLQEDISFGYNLLLEAPLTPEQKQAVDSWEKTDRAEKISGHVIPPGQHRVSFPIESAGEQSQPHPDVVSHLDQHGYQVSDYRSGLAETKDKKRKIKIGKVLSMTNADPDLRKKFENDPARAASRVEKKSGMMVTISRHPHDVANMSTNQGWTSCMDMEKGCYAHYLQDDIKKGTHVAYLHSEDDPNVESPIARIALKPFNSSKNSHVILRPESSSYGTSDNRFSEAVNKWAETNFPTQKNDVYEKDSDVYHDSGQKFVGDIDAIMKHPNSKIVTSALRNDPRITSRHIDMAMDHPDPEVASYALLDHPEKITDKHVDTAMKSANPYVLSSIASHHPDKIKPEHVDSFIKNFPRGAASIFTKRPELITPKHIEQGMLSSNDTLQRVSIDMSPKTMTLSSVLQKLANNSTSKINDIQASRNAVQNWPAHKITSDDVDTIVKHPDGVVINRMLNKLDQHGYIDDVIKPHHVDHLMSHSDPDIVVDTLRYMGNKIKDHHMDMAFQNPSSLVNNYALNFHSDKIKPHHIDMALQKRDGSAAIDMMNNYEVKDKFTPEHFDMAMRHPDSMVAMQALDKHEDKLLDRHFDMAAQHPDRFVAADAIYSHPERITSDHINKILDRDDGVGVHVFSNSRYKDKITPGHIKKALSHDNDQIRRAAQVFQASNQVNEQTQFAGKQVFTVPSQIFNEMKLQKRKGKHWSSYIKEDDYMRPIREYANKNPKKAVIIQCETTGAMMYARYPKQ